LLGSAKYSRPVYINTLLGTVSIDFWHSVTSQPYSFTGRQADSMDTGAKSEELFS